MKKKIFNGLASLILPLGAYANIAPTGAYNAGQRSYLRSGPAASMTLDIGRMSVNTDNLSTVAEPQDQLVLTQGQPVRELMVIDSAVPDKQVFYREAKPGVEIVEIDSGKPGLPQLVEILAKHKNLSALHIVSHAEDGVLLLGNSRITSESIRHEVETFAALNGALREGGDLLLYGCDLAAGDAGAELLEIVQKNTHLDLAASSNLTGAGAAGADWDLEIQHGEIESDLPFSAKALADFSHVLTGTYTLQNFGYILGGPTANTGCPTDRSGYTYGYYSLISGNYTVCGFMGLDNGTGNSFGGTTVNMSHYHNLAYSPAFLGSSSNAEKENGTHAIEVKSSTPFQLTNLVADEWPPNASWSNGYIFSNVQIVGYISGGGTVTSPVHSIVDDQATTNTFTFGATELADFAGVNLTKFRLQFYNEDGSAAPEATWATGMRLVSYTTTAPDTTAPTISDITNQNIAVGDNTGALAFTVGDNASAAANLTVTRASSNTTAVPLASVVLGGSGANRTVTVTGAAAGTSTITVTVTDQAGNSVNDTFDVVVAPPTPTVTDANISISGATGSGGAYKIGDTVTATWNNTAGGDGNSGVTGVTVDFSQFGGGAAVMATNSADTWTATYTIVSGAIDAGTRNISVTATNAEGPTTTADSTNATVDNIAPTVTDDNISISGGSGIGGTYRIGDTVTATWNNTAGGDNNSDTISVATVDFSQFGGGAAVAATNSAGTWTATYTIVSGAIDGTNRNVSVTATDNAGNATTAADTTNAIIDNVAPTVTDTHLSISGASGTGGAYKMGDTVTATWNNTASGDNNSDSIGAATVDFSQFGGGAAVAATNSAGTWTATYTIDGSSTSGSNLNVAVTAMDNAGNATTTADSSNATVDNAAPGVTSVSVPANATYVVGQNLDFTVNTSENVTVNTGGGTPQIAVTIGAATRQATYLSGSGTTALVFRYTVQAGDNDSDGIALAASIAANGGTLADDAGNALTQTLNSPGSTAAVLVDAVAPTVSSVSVPANATYSTGQNLDFTVNADENVTVNTGGGIPRIALTVGSATRYASYLSGSGTSAVVFRYTVQSGDSDTDGIAVAASIDANGGSLRDGAGNDLNTTLNSVGATTAVLVDAVAPGGHSVSFDDDTLNGTEATGISFTFAGAEVGADYSYTISSSGGGTPVNGSGTIATATDQISGINVSGLPDGTLTLSVTLTDGAGNVASAVTDIATLDSAPPSGHSVSFDQTDVNNGNHTAISFSFTAAEVAATYDYTINSSAGGTPVTGTGTVASAGQTISGLDVSGLNDGTLTLSVTLTDSAGNAAGAVTDTINKDANAPAVDTVAVTDGDFAEGDTVTVTVTLTEDVDVVGGNPTISIDIGATTRQATFTGEAGGVLTFSYTVQATDNTDGTGVTVLANSIDLTGGITVEDAGGNSADLSFSQVSNANAQVDTELPAEPVVTDPAGVIDVNTPDYELVGTHAEDGVVINLYADADNNGVADNATVLVSTSVSGGAWAMTHTLTANSDNNVVVVAEDAAGNVSAAVDVPTITHDNLAPAAPAAPDLEAASDSGASDTDDLTNVTTPDISGTAEANTTVTLSSDLDGEVGTATADGSGDWTLTASALSEGVHSLTLVATDAAGNDSPVSAALSVTVDTTGPSLSALADQRLVLGDSTGALAFTLADNVTDPAAVTLTPVSSDTAVVPLGNILLGGSDGNRTVEITGAAFGVSTVDIEAGDEAGNTATESLQVRINTPPAISGSGADSLEAGTPYSFTPNASDVDGDTLTFSISNRPSWASFNTATGRLSGTPPSSGSFSGITISVSDGLASTALGPFTINVSSAANTPPVISGTPPTQVTVGQHYHFVPSATDADGDSLSFSASGVPAWLLFDAATGSLSGMPGDAQVGTHSNIVISVSDGMDSAALAAFSITVAAGEDSDDDGVSDYQEGLDETDPNDPEDYVDTDAPQLTAPAPLVLNAEGLFTAISLRQLLGLEADADEAAVNAALTALAQDRVDGEDCCLPEVQGMSEGRIRLHPGRQLVTWMATDRKGNEALAEQTVDVRPLVSFGKGRQVGEGGTATIAVLLNGPSPVYPLTVPYVIDPASTADAADHNLTAGSVIFTETEGVPQVRAEILVDTFLDETTEGDETVLLRLDNTSGSEPPAADAAPDIHNINVGRGEFQLTISEANLAPQAQLRLWQAETTTVQVVQTAGEVTVAASVSDPNPLDSPTLSWTGTDTALLELADEGNTQLTFDPAALAVGAYRVRALATDSAGASGSAVLDFVVLSELPTLSADEDSDGDGISDAEEGTADSNGNGIPDYLDPGYATNVLPLQVDEPDRYLAECEPGTECRLGRVALTGDGGGILMSAEELTAQSIDEDPVFEPVGGIFDFEIDNLPSAGLSAEIVLPLTEAIPAEAVYRKYLDGEWVDFTEDSRNSLASAPGEPGYCPSLTLSVWEAGLNEGYHCVRLQIEDGGPNDADGEANSAVADPGAVSIAREDDGDGDGGGNGGGNGGGGNGGGGGSPSGSSSGGGGAIGLWWLPLLLAGRLRRRRRRRKNTG